MIELICIDFLQIDLQYHAFCFSNDVKIIGRLQINKLPGGSFAGNFEIVLMHCVPFARVLLKLKLSHKEYLEAEYLEALEA